MDNMMSQTYMGAMQDEFVEFWSFFRVRHHYWRRNSMVGNAPHSQTPSQKLKSTSCKRSWKTRLYSSTTKNGKSDLVYGHPAIFQGLNHVDETLKSESTIRQEIGRLYITHQILREARLPNVQDTDFLEFFDWFCINARPLLDDSQLGKLLVRSIPRS